VDKKRSTDHRTQIVDKTIMEADLDHDGKISFEEFMKMVENTDVTMSMTLDQF
jgi:serine/threonine-protein phosphatase 2B regulatory subunit